MLLAHIKLLQTHVEQRKGCFVIISMRVMCNFYLMHILFVINFYLMQPGISIKGV